jgi:hypothetical protein
LKELTGCWRKFNIELYNLYFSPNIRIITLNNSVIHRIKSRSAYKILVRKPEGKRASGNL